MKQLEFELQGEEYVQLNRLLKNLNLTGTGGESKIRIIEGEVAVNGEPEYRIRKKLRAGDEVIYDQYLIQIKA